MRSAKPEKLPDHYYLNNFRVLVDFVYANYRHLLNSTEQAFYTRLLCLPDNCQQLYIRLLMRSAGYLRRSKISYPEINAVPTALALLENAGYLRTASVDNIDDWISLFSAAELKQVLPNNERATDLLTGTDLFGDSPLDLLLESESVFEVLHKDSYLVYQLLFFGNLYQSLSEFVITDLGLRRYESYFTGELTAAELPFQSREQLQAYLQYYLCTEHLEDATAQGPTALIALHNALPDTSFNDQVLIRRVQNFSNKIARQLEREDALQDALQIYRNNQQPPARERQVRIEEKLGNLQAAHSLCETIKHTPVNAEEAEFAEFFHAKLGRKLQLTASKTKPYQPPEIAVQLAPSRLSVEYATALQFARHGHCYYVENTLISSVFGLAMWDIIFAPVPGVFYHPFQRAPADFSDPQFYSRRESLFVSRLQAIQQGKLREYVYRHLHQKKGIVNPLVHWQAVDRHLLQLALQRISTADWLALFNYLLRDIKNHRSGLPDLIWFPNAGGYQLLEVKGPGDTLQKNQRRWMQHLHDHNISHALVNADYQRTPNNPQPAPALLDQYV